MADYAPGMRVLIRDEEWMIRKCDRNSYHTFTLQCVGVSPLVRDKTAYFLSDLEKIANEIEQELQNELEREIPTSEIGEMVMKKLKDLDEVAYVRSASVYRQFKDINTFMEELTRLLEDKN